MKLSEYAQQHDITYKAAWIRYKNGKIPGAYKDDAGMIHVPGKQEEIANKVAIYARVSTNSQAEDLERQAQRLKEFATSRGYEIVETVKEVASGTKDDRAKLTRLLNRHEHWGILLVEHKDRLTRVGYNWFPTFLSLLDKQVLVVDQSTDSDEGKVEDILHILYSYAASEYGKRGAKNRAEKAAKALAGDNGE